MGKSLLRFFVRYQIITINFRYIFNNFAYYLSQLLHIVLKVYIISIGSNNFNIYGSSDSLPQQGWNLNALHFPSADHICVTYLHTQAGVVDKFINDVKEISAACL